MMVLLYSYSLHLHLIFNLIDFTVIPEPSRGNHGRSEGEEIAPTIIAPTTNGSAL